MLNLWIGLTKDTAGLPRDLYALGYRVVRIERRFPNQDGELVHPELILESEPETHTLVLEWKSGANTDDDQLRKYSRISESDLRQRVPVPPDAAQSHDVTLVGKDEHGQRLAMGLDAGSYPFPLVVEDAEGLRLDKNSFSTGALNGVFNPRLEIDWAHAPESFIRVDPDSDSTDVAAVAVPQVITYMVQMEAAGVEVQQLAQDMCKGYWEFIDTPGRDGIKAKLSAVLEDACENEFGSFWRWHGGGHAHVEIIQRLDGLDQAAKVRTLRTLSTRSSSLFNRLGVSGTQLGLFD